ncbi:hypothetical protein GQ600_6079 [Phytophthora cactorum]|nr:hypothetical protein GQ600_6079 [Phytophthora cactorum]
MIFCNCYVWVLYAYLVNNILPLFVNCCLEMFTSLVFGAIYFRWSTSRPHVHKVCAIAFPGLVAHTIYYIWGRVESRTSRTTPWRRFSES